MKILPSDQFVHRLARLIFKKEKAHPRGDLNIVFVKNPQIKKINKRFFKKDKTTDVIAFPYSPLSDTIPEATFGDIFISVPTARMNSRRLKEPLKKELARLVVHGILHLLGHKDDNKRRRTLMWRRQEEIVNSVFQSQK